MFTYISSIVIGSYLSNTSVNVLGSDANVGNPGSFSWSVSQGGYVGQFFDESTANTANGLMVKTASRTVTAFDVSTGARDVPGLSLFIVKSNGSVGIGTTIPQLRLDVAGGGAKNVMRIIGGSGQTDNDGILLIQDNSNNTAANGNNELLLFLNAGRNIIGGIGKTANADAVFYSSTSDVRLKTDIHATRYGLKDLLQIEVADYKYKGITNASQQTGFLAQQLYKIYPEAVTKGDDANEKQPYMVDYGKLTPLLVKAVQELKEQVDALQKQVKALQKKKQAGK